MKTIAILAATLAVSACASASTGFGETIHSTDIYLKYSFQDASIYAASGGPVEVYGAPQNGAPPDEVAASVRLPAYLASNKVNAVEPGDGGYRVALVFAPQAGLSGESVCKGRAKGGQAGATTKVLAVFCRSEAAILSEARLETSSAFIPGKPGFEVAMTRLMRELLPLRSPFDQGERGCRGGRC